MITLKAFDRASAANRVAERCLRCAPIVIAASGNAARRAGAAGGSSKSALLASATNRQKLVGVRTAAANKVIGTAMKRR